MDQVGLTPAQAIVVATVIMAVIGAGVRQIWVWGWTYKAKVDECDQWKRLALSLVGINEQAINKVELVVKAQKVEGA